ncbi:MAG: L-glutamate gamma-semialdehyde dehydrogenase [Candidatus Lokiarchaeota archaeon]|nr:L-glutamate gamma-semialdehyde dehydrogenase [Candidatus Lokiarchaeota archaeon]
MVGTKFEIPRPENEPTLSYLPESKERAELKAKLKEMRSEKIEIPLIIGGEEVRTGDVKKAVMPHKHNHVLGEFHNAGEKEVHQAIDAALDARESWGETPWYDRAAIFLKAADLLAGPYRSTVNAAAMLGLSKTIYQAEIDGANELPDFLRFNAYFMQDIYRTQVTSGPQEWNRMEYRPLEGFVFAVTPFNFLSIMGNLPTAPALMGNVVIWKPASSAVYTSYHVMKVLMEAGLPPGVINFVPGPGSQVGDPILKHPDLAGIHFTGSTSTFRFMWKQIGERIDQYKTFPRLVGETGGKDFVFAHSSADAAAVVTALIRGAFQYQGQKCSAASRAYIPNSLWPQTKKKLLEDLELVQVGNPENFRNFMNAVIDQDAFDNIVSYIEYARESESNEIIAGGEYDDEVGYFIDPTVVVTTDPKDKLMREEIFGPVLTIYVYPDEEYKQTLHLCDKTSPYGLTGSIFAKNRDAIVLATDILRHAAGNFYINNKPTAAVVGRQPFGGARASGTNDKAGSRINLMRWISPRSIKENFTPAKFFVYNHMSEP